MKGKEFQLLLLITSLKGKADGMGMAIVILRQQGVGERELRVALDARYKILAQLEKAEKKAAKVFDGYESVWE